MTREKAKNIFTKHIHNEDTFVRIDIRTYQNFIDNIYDGFDNRTCENCKHCNEASGVQSDAIGWQTIECEYWDGNFSIVEVYDDGFGCNKWEQI